MMSTPTSPSVHPGTSEVAPRPVLSVFDAVMMIDGTAITALSAYHVTVVVTAEAIGTVAANDGNGRPQSLRVTVTVTGPANTTVTLDGYRTRYAPNALP